MDKRLPLALFLSFLVIMGWSLFNGPRPGERATGTGTDVNSSAATGGLDGSETEPAPELPPAISETLAEESERELTYVFTDPENGRRVQARFTNKGARLLDYRLGDYFDVGELSEAERDDPEHWVRLLESIETPTGRTGSLTLGVRPGTAAERFLRGTPLEEALWSMTPITEGGGERTVGVEFRYAPGSGLTFIKRVRVFPGEHSLHVELGIRNDAHEGSGGELFRFTPASAVPKVSSDNFYPEPRAVAAWGARGERPELEEALAKESGGGDIRGTLSSPGAFSFGGVHNKYFAFLLNPAPDDAQALGAVQAANYVRVNDLGWVKDHPKDAEHPWRLIDCELDLMIQVPVRGAETIQRYVIYAGPKEEQDLTAALPAHQVLINKDLGMMSGISKIILGILRFYERIVGNWGWAIILMTFTVRLLLFPINRRMQTSMARYQTKMKRVQPLITAVKEKYKNDPKKLREEQGKIMQQEQAFPPLGGCLPMLLQIPVFWGLFQALRVDFQLRQAPFTLWIQDLAQPDRLLELGLQLPLIGGLFQYLNVLPILMVVLWIWQQRSMPTPGDEQAAKMQRMMMWMPVIFGFMLYNYAAGLSLYMITSSGLGIFEMRVIKKLWPLKDEEKAKKKNGFMSRIADLQKQQMKRTEQQQLARKKQHARRGGGGGGGGAGGGKARGKKR